LYHSQMQVMSLHKANLEAQNTMRYIEWQEPYNLYIELFSTFNR
jgi:hypothetical protein